MSPTLSCASRLDICCATANCIRTTQTSLIEHTFRKLYCKEFRIYSLEHALCILWNKKRGSAVEAAALIKSAVASTTVQLSIVRVFIVSSEHTFYIFAKHTSTRKSAKLCTLYCLSTHPHLDTRQLKVEFERPLNHCHSWCWAKIILSYLSSYTLYDHICIDIFKSPYQRSLLCFGNCICSLQARGPNAWRDSGGSPPGAGMSLRSYFWTHVEHTGRCSITALRRTAKAVLFNTTFPFRQSRSRL